MTWAVYVHGTAGFDVISVTPSGANVVLDENLFFIAYPAAEVSEFRVRMHDAVAQCAGMREAT